jgi:spore coat protein U-like protein
LALLLLHDYAVLYKMKKLSVITAFISVVFFAGAAMALDTNTLTVQGAVIGICKFDAAASTLSFGNLDPTSLANGTAQTNIGFWCTKNSAEAAITITDDSGGAYQMVGATYGETITYSVVYTKDALPNMGPGGAHRVLTIDGTVLNADYVNNSADTYSDTLIVTINP